MRTKTSLTDFLKKYKLVLGVLLIAGITGIAVVTRVFPELVVALGQRMLQQNMQADYFKGVMWAVFLGLTILIWPIPSWDKKALLYIWSIKCLVMLGIMLLYESYYQLDAIHYFAWGKFDKWGWQSLHSGGSNFVTVFITSLHRYTFLDSYQAVKVSFGMVGLAAIYVFYRAAVAFLGKERIALLYAFALFPSLLFWSSILGKEPLILLGIALYSYGAVNWIRGDSLSNAAVLFLGLAFASFMRPWLGCILGVPVFAASAAAINRQNRWGRVLFLSVLAAAILFSAGKSLEEFKLKDVSGFLVAANQKSESFSKGGSVPEDGSQQKRRFDNLNDALIFVPEGAFTALYRPLPGEVNNLFGFLAGIEGAFLLILSALAVIRFRWFRLKDPVIVWAAMLVVIWAACYGFVSYNLGTVCRYRLQILPVFLGLLLYMVFGKSGQVQR